MPKSCLSGFWFGHHHVFDPVGAVGDLHADPVDVRRVHGAVPVGAEAKDVFPEGVFFRAVVRDEADVDDVVAGRAWGEWGVAGENGLFEGGVLLDEDDEVAFRIVDFDEAFVGGFDVFEAFGDRGSASLRRRR